MEPEKNLRESIKKSSLKKLLFSPEQSDTRLKLIVVIGLAAIAVIFLSDYVGGQTQSVSAQVNAAAPLHYSGTGYEEYTAQLEARLTELISTSPSMLTMVALPIRFLKTMVMLKMVY